MKKILIWLIVAIIFSPVFAVGQTKSETIHSFESDITINADASLNIRETINYDFGNFQKHGIYRDIPVRYNARGGNYYLRILNIFVTNDKGEKQNFELSNQGKYKRIKIGDADQYVSGQKTYIINYILKRAINYFDDHDELYFNVTGNEWEIPIEQARATVHVPKGTNKDNLQSACFEGSFGSSKNCANKNVVETPAGLLAIFSQPALLPKEGLTIVVGWPKGLVFQPTWKERMLETAIDNWYWIFPIITLIGFTTLWYYKGRDPKGRGTIIAEFEVPDKLSPSQVGMIIDESLDNIDISAEIIQLAVRGYIKIQRLQEKNILGFNKEDYLLQQTKEANDENSEIERLILKKLFGQAKKVEDDSAVIRQVKLSQLNEKFHNKLEAIKKRITDSVINKGYFKHDPSGVKLLYLVGSIFVFVGGAVMGVYMQNIYLAVSLALCGLIMFVFSFIMPQRTFQGVVAKEHLQGLKLYLSVAEKDRLEFHNAPEKNPQTFEKYLAYAMVLGVVDAWAKQFETIYTQPPSWYADPGQESFSSILFTHQLNKFSSSASHSMSSVPHSSASSGGSGFGGGGFSGGGFGGGGGGSW